MAQWSGTLFGAIGTRYRHLLVRLVELSGRAARWIAGGAVLLTAVLLYYTATHLILDTNTTDMLDPSLPFRMRQAEFDRAFPQLSELIVAVVDGKTADRAEDVADALAAKLRRQSGLFQSIYQPGQGPFFERNGLLYLDNAELSDLADHLAAAEPFLATLARDMSLRGLFSILGRALEKEPGQATETLLKTSFERIAATVEAQLAGREQRLSWRQEMLGDTQAGGDERRRFVLIQPRLDYTSLQPGEKALARVRAVIAELHLDGGQGKRVRLTGPVALDDEELQSVSEGAGIATFLSFTLICLILFLGLRSPRLVLSLLITLFIGLVWSAAFAVAAVGHLNLISVTFAVLFIGLGVDFGIQFAMRYREELARDKNHDDALARAAGGAGGALTLATAAAAISFFSFMPTNYRGLGELGFIAGASMFVALLVTLVVLPALMSLLPVKAALGKPGRSRLARWASPVHYRAVLWTTALIAVGAGLLLPQARFDFNPLNLKDPGTESAATFRDLLRDPQSTPYTIDVLAPNLATAERLAARLDNLNAVDKTMTLASFVPSEQEEKLSIIDDMNLFLAPVFEPTEHRVRPSAKEQLITLAEFQDKLAHYNEKLPAGDLAASVRRLSDALGRLKTLPGWPDRTLKKLEDRLLGDLPKNLVKLKSLLAPDEVGLGNLPQDLKERYITPDGRARIEVFPTGNMSDNQQLRHFVTAVQTVVPEATGAPVTLVEGGRAVIEACVQAIVSALLAAFVLMVVMMRSIRDALLILTPLLLALLFTVATSVLLDLPLNFANVIALPLLLGIGVAFGIYLVGRKRGGIDIKQLFHSSTPRAVLFSGLTTIASFGMLAISGHPGMSSMGLLIAFALTYALVCTLVVLPAIMAAIEARKLNPRGG